MAEIYRFLIPPDASVLEIGCAQGDLLASLGASRSVGVDFSEEMIQRGRHKHPDLSFLHTDAHDFSIDEKNYVINCEGLVRCLGKTGVEMEALTAVSVALLTVYDMCKSFSKNLVISKIMLLKKSGGKSGSWSK